MKICRKILLVAFLLAAALLAAPESAEVQSIQYRSQKITSHQKDLVTANAIIHFANGNVKIEYLSPEKRTLMLSGSTAYMYGENKKDVVTYNWSTLPAVMNTLLQPSIFAAADFLNNIRSFTLQDTGVKSGSGTIWTATPKEQKNISKIEYVFDAEKALVHSYKLISKEGAVISEVQFLDYRVHNDKYYLPSAIQTVIHSTEGLIEEKEEFSRIRVDGAINKNIFKF